QAGAHIVGGCCGTTPEHIKAIVEGVRPLAPRLADVGSGSATGVAAPARRALDAKGTVQAVPLVERSKWGAKIAKGQFVTSVEIVPPRGVDASRMLTDVRKLKDANVDAVNVPDGPRAQSRMGALLT